MFIKKDLRKIPVIFSDSAKAEDGDDLTELRLARRPAEFNGSISALCQPNYAPSLQKLTKLSLYECQISSLEGIRFIAEACPVLEEMNLGRNPLGNSGIPDEFRLIQSLKALWLDDCEIEGSIPPCIFELKQLQVLRISNNRVEKLSRDVGNLKNLEVLCLDGNLIENVPEEIVNLTKLKSLLFR